MESFYQIYVGAETVYDGRGFVEELGDVLQGATVVFGFGLWEGKVEDSAVISLFGTEHDVQVLLQWLSTRFPSEETFMVVEFGPSISFVESADLEG